MFQGLILFFQPKDPVRPATPVRPVTPVGDIPQEHYFKAIEPFDTLPLSIPRIDIRKNDGSKASNSPHSFSSYNGTFMIYLIRILEIIFK